MYSTERLIYGTVASSPTNFFFYIPQNQHHHTTPHWQPHDGGYRIHVASNAAEWLCFGFLIVLALTYFDEFQQVILLIDAQEKSPTIISYDGIGIGSSYEGIGIGNSYEGIGIGSLGEDLDAENNN